MSLSIPQKLIEQLKKGNVVLFCGAGISVSEGGLPSGGQLARELAEQAGRPEIANAPLPDVAQAYELEMDRHDLVEYIAGRIDDPRYVPLRTHQLIAALPFTKIVTTNWDNLLEKAMDHADKFFVKVVDDLEVAYADEAKVLLIKLHGSIEQKDSIIITGDDYYDVFARLPETATLVRTYFATKTVLFLGFGLADEDFKRLYHGVVRRIGVHKRRAYAVQLNPDELTVKYWKQKNVQIVAADATVFLEALADASGEDIVPIAPPSEPTPGVARQPRRVEATPPGQARKAEIRKVPAKMGTSTEERARPGDQRRKGPLGWITWKKVVGAILGIVLIVALAIFADPLAEFRNSIRERLREFRAAPTPAVVTPGIARIEVFMNGGQLNLDRLPSLTSGETVVLEVMVFDTNGKRYASDDLVCTWSVAPLGDGDLGINTDLCKTIYVPSQEYSAQVVSFKVEGLEQQFEPSDPISMEFDIVQ